MQFVVEKLNESSLLHTRLVLSDLRDLKIDFYRKYYPRVEEWYATKLLPGFKDGSRMIQVVRRDSKLYGMSIVRASPEKSRNKLCTFFLLPEARGYGVGRILMERSLEQLTSADPDKSVIVTIPEERLREKVGNQSLIHFFAEFGFETVGRKGNRYRAGKDEYVCRASSLPMSRSKTITFMAQFPSLHSSYSKPESGAVLNCI